MTGRPIVVGCDGSVGSQAALRWAVDEAAVRRSKLLLVHASPTLQQFVRPFGAHRPREADALREAGQSILDDATAVVAALSPDLHVEAQLASTTVNMALSCHSAAHEMVVVGSRGQPGFTDLPPGSGGVRLAGVACPVVLVQADEHPEGMAPRRRQRREQIVVGVDSLETSLEALSFAFEEASLRGVGLTALHAWQSPYFDGATGRIPQAYSLVADEFQASESRVLGERIQSWTARLPSVALVRRVVHADPASALAHGSREAALLVIGFGGDESASPVLGPVTRTIIGQAKCPVAIVRHSRRATTSDNSTIGAYVRS